MLLYKKLAAAALTATTALSCANALANDGTLVSLGLRLWNNEWTSWDVYPAVPGSLAGASENFTSSSRLVAIPIVSVRHGDWLISGSHFVNRSYDFTGNEGQNFSAKRKETDVLAGYYVLPTLAVTLGYKEVKQDFGGGAQFKYTGPTIGAVASAPLTQGFSLYGNFGYGFMKAKLPAGLGAIEANGKSKLDADYLLGEVGLAYSFDAKSISPALKAMTATIGYRSQVLTTKDFRLRTSDGRHSRATDLRDTTEGLSLGLSVSF